MEHFRENADEHLDSYIKIHMMIVLESDVSMNII